MRAIIAGALAFSMATAAAAQPYPPEGGQWLIDQTAGQVVDRIRPIATACACEVRSPRWCELAIQRIQGDADKRAAGYAETDALKAYAAAVLRTAAGVAYSVTRAQVQETREAICAAGSRWQSGLQAWDDALLNGSVAPNAP